MNVLVTGAAGFVGSVLVTQLLKEGYTVVGVDNLTWGKQGLSQNLSNPRFKLVQGDIRDEKLMCSLLEDTEVVVHLAALVGYQLCEQDKALATDVNVNGSKKICKYLSGTQLLIYSSTGSVYGPVNGLNCTEEQAPNPQTHYAATKAQAEAAFSDKNNVVILRFATAFGFSPRMRLDLLVNQFVYEAVKNKALTVYQKDFIRPIIHVQDISSSILFAIKNRQSMSGQTFNVGSPDLTFTKEEIALRIKKKIYFDLKFNETNADHDKRNYRLSTQKIASLGYRANVSLEEGICELVPAIQNLKSDGACFNR